MSAEKGANIRQPFSPNTLPPHSPHAVFLKFGQLYLFRPAKCISQQSTEQTYVNPFLQHTLMQFSSCCSSQIWSTVFVQTSKVYFSAEKEANIHIVSHILPTPSHPPNHAYANLLIVYFLNLLNCICPDMPLYFSAKKEQTYVRAFLPTPFHQNSGFPPAAFRQFGQLDLSRHAECISWQKRKPTSFHQNSGFPHAVLFQFGQLDLSRQAKCIS